MKKNIILHVGTEKTGSSSIQKTLRANANTLKEHGVLYPLTIGDTSHIKLTACVLDDLPSHPIRKLLGLGNQSDFSSFREYTLSTLRREIKNSNSETIIISDEHINVHLTTIRMLQKLASILEEFGSINSVIIYLRRQDEFRLSFFSQAVKEGNLTNFDLDNPLPKFEKLPYRLDYLAILQNLEMVFGKEALSPVIFNRRTFRNGSVINDFVEKIGLEGIVALEEAVDSNKSIDARIIKPLAVLSTFLKSKKNLGLEPFRHQLITESQKLFQGKGPVLAPERHNAFLEQFKAQNQLIAEEFFFFTKNDGMLFPAPSHPDTEFYPDCSISLKVFLLEYISRCLVSAQSNHIEVWEKFYSENHQIKEIEAQSSSLIKATCAVCGNCYNLAEERYSREKKLCTNCNASGRTQSVAFHLSTLISPADEFTPLIYLKSNKNLKVAGLSDSKIYADVLEAKFDYTNTFFHKEPLLDVTNPPADILETLDILIATEVFEHVIGPSQKAFDGAVSLLKSGGYFILTVPFVNKGESIDHYPDTLIGYEPFITNEGKWAVKLEYSDKATEIDYKPKFHGGPGKTLEIRLFNRARILQELTIAGFVDIIVHDKNMPEYGIYWGAASRTITARKPKGHFE